MFEDGEEAEKMTIGKKAKNQYSIQHVYNLDGIKRKLHKGIQSGSSE